MSHFSFDSLRFRLLMLVVIAIVPTLGLAVYAGLEQRRVAALEAQANALQLARLAAADQDRLIADAHQLLNVLAHFSDARDCPSTSFSAFLAGLLEDYPLYADLGVARLDGAVVCSAIPSTATLNVAERSWFRDVLQTRDLAVGDYEIGRVRRTRHGRTLVRHRAHQPPPQFQCGADPRGAGLADASNIFQFRIAGMGDVFQRRELVQLGQGSIRVAQNRPQQFDQRRGAGSDGIDTGCECFSQSLQGWS